MPSGSRDNLPLTEIIPGYSSRMADWGGITVAFEKAHKGQDASSMVKGLPDDRCQAPHWGYLFSGTMIVEYGIGRRRSRAARPTTWRRATRSRFETDCEALSSRLPTSST